MYPRIIVLSLLFCIVVHAQWLNYKEPGVPRLKDGKVTLSAPAPRTSNHKPDLTGVWMHEPTPTSELKRLYGGTSFDEEFQTLPPGMNIELQTKYGWDILVDFGANPPLGAEAIAFMRRCTPKRPGIDDPPPGCFAGLSWPLAGLVSEPIKIIQAPRETIVFYEVGNLHRQTSRTGACFPPNSNCRHFSATPWGIGRTTRSSSRRGVSMTKECSTKLLIRAARRCT